MRFHSFLRAGRWLLVALAVQLSACGGGGGEDIVRRSTTLGEVEGSNLAQKSGTFAWLGIPYAKPPTGALRWMPPAAAEPWTGTRSAKAFGRSCAQGGRYFSPGADDTYGLHVRDTFGKPVGSEDCLTLNIWRPASIATDLPVIVFIYGGSNISGYSSDPLANGEALAARTQSVVVTINYRLGLFGWLNLSQLKTGDAIADSGNFATLDIVQALKFVNANIRNFGGDPGNVTVMGESAGAVNAWSMLVVNPGTKGLMHKMVSMSGGMATVTASAARTYADNLVRALAIADGRASDTASANAWLATQTPAQVAGWLRAKPADDVLKVALANNLGSAPAVITDGSVIPASPLAAITAGNYNAVPALVSNTRDEGKLFGGAFALKPSEYDRFGMQFNFNPDAPPGSLAEADLLNPGILPVDKPGTGWNAVAANLTSAIFTGPGAVHINTLAQRQGDRIWYSRFDWDEEPAPFNTVFGAVHAMDLPFVFGNFGQSVFSFGFSAANRPGREALSDAMMRSLGAFAKTGNPNNAALGVNWPNWPSTLVFDASATRAEIRIE